MIEIKYVSSNRKKYNLIGEMMRVTSGNFHKYSWKADVKEGKYGEVVNGFKKDAISYPMTLTIRGTLEERKAFLNDLRNSFEQDVLTKKPGTIYYGEYYIKCYIVSSDTQVSDVLSCWSKDEIEIYCPYPFWIREQSMKFYPGTEVETSQGLDFPLDFPFDFAAEKTGTQKMLIDHYAPCHFKMTIYGSCTNPRVMTNGYPRQVFTELEEHEYLEIDSKDSTVIKCFADGVKQSIYNSRQFEPSIFEKMESGMLTFEWNGTFGFDVVIYEERSEPKW